jgi:hypothetical protein
MLMTKQLKRLNYKPPYSTCPTAASGHRHINKRKRESGNYSYTIYFKKTNSRSFKYLKLALCYKFIMILKFKSNLI